MSVVAGQSRAAGSGRGEGGQGNKEKAPLAVPLETVVELAGDFQSFLSSSTLTPLLILHDQAR